MNPPYQVKPEAPKWCRLMLPGCSARKYALAPTNPKRVVAIVSVQARSSSQPIRRNSRTRRKPATRAAAALLTP